MTLSVVTMSGKMIINQEVDSEDKHPLTRRKRRRKVNKINVVSLDFGDPSPIG